MQKDEIDHLNTMIKKIADNKVSKIFKFTGELDQFDAKIQYSFVDALKKNTNIEVLKIDDMNVRTAEIISDALPQLRLRCISFNKVNSTVVLKIFSKLPKSLEKIEVIHVDEASVKEIMKQIRDKKIKSINLLKCPYEIAQNLIVEIKSCPSIEKIQILNLQSGTISRLIEDLKNIPHLPTILVYNDISDQDRQSLLTLTSFKIQEIMEDGSHIDLKPKNSSSNPSQETFDKASKTTPEKSSRPQTPPSNTAKEEKEPYSPEIYRLKRKSSSEKLSSPSPEKKQNSSPETTKRSSPFISNKTTTMSQTNSTLVTTEVSETQRTEKRPRVSKNSVSKKSETIVPSSSSSVVINKERVLQTEIEFLKARVEFLQKELARSDQYTQALLEQLSPSFPSTNSSSLMNSNTFFQAPMSIPRSWLPTVFPLSFDHTSQKNSNQMSSQILSPMITSETEQVIRKFFPLPHATNST